MMTCLSAPLAMCHGVAGNFCDVARPQVYATQEVVEFMVANDPAHVRVDLGMNAYGEQNCTGWSS